MPTARTGGVATRAVAVLFTVSLAACLVLGFSWWRAAGDPEVAYAAERDRALHDGRAAIISFNTLDHRDVPGGLDRWERDSTGPLREEIKQGRQRYAEQIERAGSTTEAQVVDAGLTQLDARAGKAEMLAVVRVTVTVQGQPPSTKQDRYHAELTREGAVWKLSNLQAVPVG